MALKNLCDAGGWGLHNALGGRLRHALGDYVMPWGGGYMVCGRVGVV